MTLYDQDHDDVCAAANRIVNTIDPHPVRRCPACTRRHDTDTGCPRDERRAA